MGIFQLPYSKLWLAVSLLKATERHAAGLNQPMNICRNRANYNLIHMPKYEREKKKRSAQHKVVMETTNAKGHCQKELG